MSPRNADRHHALRQVHRSLQAHPLGHRPRRDPRPRSSTSRKKFLPDGLSQVDRLRVPRRRRAARLLSQIQGRTYANMFGLVERFIGAKMLEVSRDHWLGDQIALEALVRFTDEELKHQELFRRIERMIGRGHAGGLPLPAAAERRRVGRARQVDLGGAGADLPHRALHAGALPRRASSPTPNLSDAVEGRVPVPLEGGVAARDPRRAGVARARTRSSRRRSATTAVDDLIALVGAVDGMLQVQAQADADYFAGGVRPGARRHAERRAVEAHDARRLPLAVHRLGVQDPRFTDILRSS